MRPARAIACLLALALVPAAAQDVAVRGGVVHTMEGESIENGVVLVRGGRIEAVGPAASVRVPPGTPTLSAAVVTPGLIDAHSSVGLAGWLNVDHDRDELEASGPLQPELRAVDAYNPREPLIAWVRGFGVTTVHTGHAPGAVLSGQTLIAKTRGDTVGEAVIVPEAMVVATLGAGATRGGDELPGTRAKAVAILREKLWAASEYAAKRASAEPGEEPPRDLALDALASVLAGERPLLVTAQRAHDIAAALRIAREFELRLVLDGACEAPLVVEELVAAGVPVLVHPTMARSSGETENLSMETAATLLHAGVPLALQSGYESYVPRARVVVFEAGVAAANGLSFREALGAVTIEAARILGIDGRVGSLAPGKDGDLALWDGDPFEYTTHCLATVIEGEVVSEGPR